MAILDEKTLDFISSSFEQTVRLGVRLGELLDEGHFICLSGEMGTGKTALARGIGRGWGASLRVTSPSYVIVNQYPRLSDGLILNHIDCYRLESEAGVVTSGLEDILNSGGAIMVEWPERIEYLLPENRLNIELRHISETRRGLRFRADDEKHSELLREFRQSAFGV